VDPPVLDRLAGRYAGLRFFGKVSDDIVTFDLDGQGKVTRLVIHTGGRSIPVNRIE
jgi:hypothetical protein